jgi:hypothetical protein
LGGTFVLEPAAGFVPSAGTVLHLLDYASVTGKFSAIDYPAGTCSTSSPWVPPR